MSDMRRMMMMFTRPIDSGGGGGEVEVPAPTILPASGNISPSQTISISIEGSAVSAEYSTDNVNWVAYTVPFTLSGNITVYARAVDADGNYSNVVSNSYTLFPYDAQVEWLGSDSTAYIDTGVNGNNYYLRFTGHFTYTTHVNYGAIYGNYVSDNHNGTRLILANASNKAYLNLNTICSRSTEVTLSINVKHYFFANYNEVTIDSTTTTVSNKGNGTANNGNVCLFNRSLTNVANRNIGLKIYDFQVYDNGVLIRDYIPVRVGTVGYMYDRISGTLFGNSGTGAFTYGNDITI